MWFNISGATFIDLSKIIRVKFHIDETHRVRACWLLTRHDLYLPTDADNNPLRPPDLNENEETLASLHHFLVMAHLHDVSDITEASLPAEQLHDFLTRAIADGREYERQIAKHQPKKEPVLAC